MFLEPLRNQHMWSFLTGDSSLGQPTHRQEEKRQLHRVVPIHTDPCSLAPNPDVSISQTPQRTIAPPAVRRRTEARCVGARSPRPCGATPVEAFQEAGRRREGGGPSGGGRGGCLVLLLFYQSVILYITSHLLWSAKCKI